LSLEDIQIQIVDRRDETPPKVGIILVNFPDEITKKEVQIILDAIRRKFGRSIATKRTSVDTSRLKQALDQGLITQAVYDQLTDE